MSMAGEATRGRQIGHERVDVLVAEARHARGGTSAGRSRARATCHGHLRVWLGTGRTGGPSSRNKEVDPCAGRRTLGPQQPERGVH